MPYQFTDEELAAYDELQAVVMKHRAVFQPVLEDDDDGDREWYADRVVVVSGWTDLNALDGDLDSEQLVAFSYPGAKASDLSGMLWTALHNL